MKNEYDTHTTPRNIGAILILEVIELRIRLLENQAYLHTEVLSASVVFHKLRSLRMRTFG